VNRTRKSKTIALTGLVFILVSSAQGVQAAQDPCDPQRNALKRHSVEPLISQRTSAKYGACAGEIVKSGLGVLFGETFDSSCAKHLAEASVDEAAGNFVDNEIKKHKNRREVQGLLDDNANKQVVTAHSISGSIDRLRDCRIGEVNRIRSDYKRERISGPKRNDRLEGVKDRIRKDNQIIAELIGEAGENLEVLEASNDTLADIDTSDRGTSAGSGSSGQSKAIDDAARSQEELERQQDDYADLLAQIDDEKPFTDEDA